MARTAGKSDKSARAQKKPSVKKAPRKSPAAPRAAASASRPKAAAKPAAAAPPAPAPAPGPAPAPEESADKRPAAIARSRPASVAPPPAGEEPVKTSVTIETARAIVEASDAAAVSGYVQDLLGIKPTALVTAARILEEILGRKPEMLVPQIERLVAAIGSQQKRAVQTAALALPVMARLAPARVARHLPVLTERFPEASDTARDGLVATFAGLCTASVAYQKRLEPVLELALSTADPAILQRWSETILPSLKGEPHARARAVVEGRLPDIPRALAQPIAAFLGIKLRPAVTATR